MTAIRPSAIGAPSYSQTMVCERASVAMARSMIRVALLTWDLSMLMDDGLLIVSELATNAVQHSRCDLFSVRITLQTAARVRLIVTDTSTERPLLREPDDDSQAGRGLLLVSTLADAWGTDFNRGGKEVWAELSVADS